MTDRITAEAGHTATPWEVYAHPINGADDAKAELAFQVDLTDPISSHLYLINAGGKCPALTGCGPTSEANAAHIVRCVNSHDELLEALRKARTALRRAANTAKTVGLSRDLNRQADEIDAALSRAQGTAS